MPTLLTNAEMPEGGTSLGQLSPTSPRGWLVLRSMDEAQITAVGDNGSLFPHNLCLSSCFSTHCLVCFASLEVLRIELGAPHSRRHSAD